MFLGLLFQSTLPVRGATAEGASTLASGSISIHAPRTGSDYSAYWRSSASYNFNPRSPYGERRLYGFCGPNFDIFQSTLPVRGATRTNPPGRGVRHISIHAPRTGSDDWGDMETRLPLVFQSTLPVRGATAS